MDNQHRKIKGYRELSIEEIETMNKIKEIGIILGKLEEELKNVDGLDGRWLSIGTTDLQKGLMAWTRAVAQPTFF